MNTKQKLYYPTPVHGVKGFYLSLAFGLFIALFLWFFEPFNINNQGYTDFEILFFGVISFGVFFIAHTLLPLVFPNIYRESKWTVYSQTIFYLVLSFAISTLNGLYINFLNDLSFNWPNYWFIILRTLVLASFPIILYIFISYYWRHKASIREASSLSKGLSNTPKEQEGQNFIIKTHIKEEVFRLVDSDFLFAKASGNYIEVYNSGETPKLYRMSLSDLKKQLQRVDYIVRCHRSYLVNSRQITNVRGNAQGLKLLMQDGQTQLPVSRKYLEQVKSVLDTA